MIFELAFGGCEGGYLVDLRKEHSRMRECPGPLLPISVQDGTWVIWKMRPVTGVERGREVGNELWEVRD